MKLRAFLYGQGKTGHAEVNFKCSFHGIFFLS